MPTKTSVSDFLKKTETFQHLFMNAKDFVEIHGQHS